jgi:hypothetical protein
LSRAGRLFSTLPAQSHIVTDADTSHHSAFVRLRTYAESQLESLHQGESDVDA